MTLPPSGWKTALGTAAVGETEDLKLYLSRFAFRAIPGKTGAVEEELKTLATMIVNGGGAKPRILHTHFASPGAADVVFEQEAADLAALEGQIKHMTENVDFQMWTKKMSGLLAESPKREIYLIVDDLEGKG